MKDLWLTYDLPPIEGTPKNFMTILENCKTTKDKDGNMVIVGGKEITPSLDELKKIAKIFNDAIAYLEEK